MKFVHQTSEFGCVRNITLEMVGKNGKISKDMARN